MYFVYKLSMSEDVKLHIAQQTYGPLLYQLTGSYFYPVANQL